MGFANRAIVAAGLGFAVSALVGCGSSGGLLTRSQANMLRGQLDTAYDALADDRCAAAQSAISDFQGSVDSLSAPNSTVLNNLDNGANKIATLAARDCPVIVHSGGTHRTSTNTRTTATNTNTQTNTTDTNTVPTTTYTYPYPGTTITTDTNTGLGTTTTTTTTGTDTGTGTDTTGTTTTTDTNTTPSGGDGLGGTTTTSTNSGGTGLGSGSGNGQGNQ